MPTQEIRQIVNLRLEELYRRHLSLHDDEIVGYYGSDLQYSKPEQTTLALYLRQCSSSKSGPG